MFYSSQAFTADDSKEDNKSAPIKRDDWKWEKHYKDKVTEKPNPNYSRKDTFGILAGLGFRGILAEHGKFHERLIAEGGLYFNSAYDWVIIDLASAVGQMFKEEAQLHVDVRSRFYFPAQYHTYVGGGTVLKGDKTPPYGIIGIGRKLYAEINIRESEVRPLAAIFSAGFRGRF